jgi:hypothetical protein
MSNNPRDTQFAGFAKALYDDIRHMFDDLQSQKYWGELDEAKQTEEDIKSYIARRAYDLIEHACDAIDDKQWDYESRLSSWHMRESIPDMPVLPEEKQ